MASTSCMESAVIKTRRHVASFCRFKSLRYLFYFLACSTCVQLLASPQYADTTVIRQRAQSFLTKHVFSNNPQNSREKEMFSDYSTIFKTPIVNCANIFKGDKEATDLGIQTAKDNLKKGHRLSDQYYINLTQNCDNFKKSRGYITSHLTKEEKEFPIAYSIVTYKDIEMVERLLRVIYRPQNFYCIHADVKASKEYFEAATAIAGCFPNVFLSSKRSNVRWGRYTVLEPEVVCMKDLWAKGSWKYFINLTGQEMPLKTNSELVQILTAYRGANDIEGTIKRIFTQRYYGKSPPLGMRAVRGAVHIVANRDYVDYILHNENATILLNWVKHTDIPDETFFAMLNHNPQLGIPGTYSGVPETDSLTKPFLARYKIWDRPTRRHTGCAGNFSRHVCGLSTGDLPLLDSSVKLFANKFHLYNDTVVIGCLEEKLFNRTRDEFLGLKHFNSTYYQTLGFVLNQVGRNSSSDNIQVKSSNPV